MNTNKICTPTINIVRTPLYFDPNSPPKLNNELNTSKCLLLRRMLNLKKQKQVMQFELSMNEENIEPLQVERWSNYIHRCK